MVSTRTRAALMAGAATLSLTAAAFASEFGNAIIFGDRHLDAGQHQDHTIFLIDGDQEGDGRVRATNRDRTGDFGNFDSNWIGIVTNLLGDGDVGPSQPRNPLVFDGSAEVDPGLNYAALGHDAEAILGSVNGRSVLGEYDYLDPRNNDRVVNEGSDRFGLLDDVDRADAVAGSVVFISGGGRDIRNLANIEALANGMVDLNASRYSADPTTNSVTAQAAANDIAEGAIAMRDAGADLVVVTNLFDVGDTPEVFGDSDLAQATLDGGDTVIDGFGSPVIAPADLQTIATSSGTVAAIRSAGTDAFNEELSNTLDGEQSIILLDQNALIGEVIADPARFGLDADLDHSRTCLSETPDMPCEAYAATYEPDNVLFANGVDLTRAGHQMLAEQAASVIGAPIQFSGIPLTAIASGREVARAGETQVSPEHIRYRGWAPFLSGGLGQSTWNALEGEGNHGALRFQGVAGVTYTFGNGIAVGAAGGYQSTTEALSDTTVDYDGTAVYGTIFAGADLGRVFGNASVTVGQIDYDRVTRTTPIGAAMIENSGQTEADVFGAGIEIGVRALSSGTISAGPIASLDHWAADVDGYAEDGWAATAVSYDGIDTSSTRGSLGLFLEAGDLADPNMPLAVRAKALYTREFTPGGIDVTASAATSPNSDFTREGRGPQADSMTVGAQVVYDFGPVIGAISYDARIGESDDHAGRIDLSIPLGGR